MPTDYDDEDLQLIADGVRDVCHAFDDEYWSRCDREHEFPWDFARRMGEGGWVGIAIPEEYGGGGRGITEAAVMLKEVAASGAAMNGCSALHLTVFGLNPVVRFGNDRLRETFLPRVQAAAARAQSRTGAARVRGDRHRRGLAGPGRAVRPGT